MYDITNIHHSHSSSLVNELRIQHSLKNKPIATSSPDTRTMTSTDGAKGDQKAGADILKLLNKAKTEFEKVFFIYCYIVSQGSAIYIPLYCITGVDDLYTVILYHRGG